MEYIIYGAGGNGKKICDALLASNNTVKYFIDLYSKESVYNGIQIFRPNQAMDRTTTVLVSLSCLSNAVKAELIADNYVNCLNLNEVMKEFQCVFDAFFSQEHMSILQESEVKNQEKLTWLEDNLNDELSKKTLNKIRSFRRNPNPSNYLENDWKLQYFPDELIQEGLIPSPLRMIDCGAFNGDTLARAESIAKIHNIPFESIVCFEPDEPNFKALINRITKGQSDSPKIYTMQAGVWSHNDVLTFSSCADQSKNVSNDSVSTFTVPVFAIDNVCYGQAPNFIKMDVEGAEIEAIHGAAETIRKYKPNLALSVYHEPEHLWKIAEIVKDLNLNYQLYLYAHGDFCNEIILYAINKE